MEALSGVASGMAVASLSIQLIDSIETIKTFVRNVKDAQQELERLVDLLERLEALLEDVRALMERQTSLQSEHFPMPSMTIFKCLKSCEKTLEPLHAIVDKYTPAPSKVGTRMDKLKTGLRFSLKAKDVKDFETRIEREIGFLHASLGANCGAILMQLGPALLKNQNNNENTHLCPTELVISDSKSAIVSSKEDLTSLSITRTTRVSSSVIPVHSSLERMGVYRRKIVRRIPGNSEQSISGCEHGNESIISEDYETTLLWSVLGYGLTWIQCRSFGVVLPSLSTFPLVHNFCREVHSALASGTIQDFQNLLHRGVIHPFSLDSDGQSLLHIAASYSRADIYLLLRKLGLKHMFDIWGESPLMTENGWVPIEPTSNRISTCRCIFEDPEFPVDRFLFQDLPWGIQGDPEVIKWLYQQITTMYLPEDAFQMQLELIEGFCKVIRDNSFDSMYYSLSSRIDYPGLDIKGDLLDYLQLGGGDLVESLFLGRNDSYESFITGDEFLTWLSKSSLNVEQLVMNQIAKLGPGALLKSWPYDQRVVFRTLETGEWKLGFEWALDEEACGYLLVSEYQCLTIESEHFSYSYMKRPFLEHIWKRIPGELEEWKPKQDLRFRRRMAVKARKERARNGQKTPRIRMPGAWVN